MRVLDVRVGVREVQTRPARMGLPLATLLLGIIVLAPRVVVAQSLKDGRSKFITDCATTLGPRSDSGLLAGCFQAEATIESGKSTDLATEYLGESTLSAGKLALIGSGIASLAALTATWIAGLLARRNSKRTFAAGFTAEISSVLVYLNSVNIAANLRDQATAKERKPFHPGNADNWLRLYYSRPDSVGLFSREVSKELVWFYARMFAQFGRLLYLHNLSKDAEATVGMAAINVIQGEIAATLVDLKDRGSTLVKRLGGKQAYTDLLHELEPLALATKTAA